MTAGETNLSEMARAAGVRNTCSVNELDAFEHAVEAAYKAEDASFITAKVTISTRRVSYSSLDGVENKYRFVRHIEQSENIEILKKPTKALPQDVK